MQFLESVVKMPLMNLPVRSVVIAHEQNKILISPGSCLTKEQLQQLGPVTDLVAPSLLHCAGMIQASAIFPSAKKWGPVHAPKVKPEINWTHELHLSNWPYASVLPMIPLRGIPQINEVIFFHKESKSLILTDLCFNLTEVSGVGAWIILHLFGTYRKFAMSKFFAKYIRDREQFKNSLEELLLLDFENVILSHGENIIGCGKEKLQKAFTERGF